MRTIKLLLGSFCIILVASCGNNKNGYDASGTFEATEVIVSSEASGKIIEFDIKEGNTIEKGEAVGLIDTLQLHLSKKQLEANMRTLKGRKTDINLQLASMKEQLTNMRTEKKRFENLVKSNAGNQKQVDDLNAQILILEKQISAQQNNMQIGNQGIDNESEALYVQLEQIEDKITKSTISSPINGTVLLKYAEQGELAQPGKALFKVADMDNMYLRAYITVGQLTKLQLGQEVKVLADFGADGTRDYKGTISWISDKSEFTPKTIQTKDERANLVYAVKIAVKNDGYLKIGMYGQMSINN